MSQLANVEYFYLKCNNVLRTTYTANDWGGASNKLKVINLEWLVAATKKVYQKIHAPKTGCTLKLSTKFSSNNSKTAVTVELADKVINYLRNFNKICDVDCNCPNNCNCVCKSNCTCSGTNYCDGSACQCNCNCECGSTSECDCTSSPSDPYPCNCTVLFPTYQCTQPMTQNCTQCACQCACPCTCTCTCPSTGSSGSDSTKDTYCQTCRLALRDPATNCDTCTTCDVALNQCVADGGVGRGIGDYYLITCMPSW